MIKLNENWKLQNGKYKCPYCKKEFSKYGICTHIWRMHTEEGKEFIPKHGTAWNKGLTKETSDAVRRNAEGSSKTIRKKIKEGTFNYIFKKGSKEAKKNGRKGGLISASNNVKRSKNEIHFFELCKKYFLSVDCNKPIFNGWDSDIIINDMKIAVLWNGIWHYKKLFEKHSLKQVQSRDKIKLKEIKKCGYIPYIIKDMGSEDKKFVIKEFYKFINFKLTYNGM